MKRILDGLLRFGLLGTVAVAIPHWAYAQDVATAPPGPGWPTLAGWAAVLALAAWALARTLKIRGNPFASDVHPLDVSVLSRARIAGRWEVVVVRAMGRNLLLGTGPQGVRLLADLGDERTPASTRAESDDVVAASVDELLVDLEANKSRAFDEHLEDAVPWDEINRSFELREDKGWSGSLDELDMPEQGGSRHGAASIAPASLEQNLGDVLGEAARAQEIRRREKRESTARALATERTGERRPHRLAPDAGGSDPENEMTLIRQRLRRYKTHQEESSP